MEISIKSLILAGIGTMAYSYEKGVSLIDEMVKKGELTVNQGKELNEELKKKVSSGKDTVGTEKPLTAESLKEILSGLNLATKDDIDKLEQRISKLENK